MDNIVEMTINAMFYAYFVVFAGGMAIVTAALIGIKLYQRSQNKQPKKQRKTVQ